MNNPFWIMAAVFGGMALGVLGVWFWAGHTLDRLTGKRDRRGRK